MSESIYEEFKRVGDIGVVGAALPHFARSLSPDGEYKLSGKRWVYRPDNFVTFQVQVRKPVIVLTLSGHPVQFKSKAEVVGLAREWLELDKEMSEYSRYKITSSTQLLPAAQFIKFAFEYRHRRKKV